MSNHDRVVELLSRWEDLREQGQDVSSEELCREAPELLPELNHQLQQLRAMEWLDHGDDDLSVPSLSSSPSLSPTMVTEVKIPSALGDRYQMESLLAEGGFGQVWRATDTVLLRPVAIKVTSVNCFAEARRVARLKHHGIITVHDVGNANGLCYIVFDLVEGRTLADEIARGPMRWSRAAELIVEVAQSLQFAHEKGFIHRDIKPSNILIDGDGRPVLADFGIAVTECELKHEAVTSAGTLAYMAPEQLQAAPSTDFRSDVYGLGVVFYELLTGRVPFQHPTLSGLRHAILHGEPISPRHWNPAIPEDIAAICLQSLSTRIEDRYRSVKQLAEAITRHLSPDMFESNRDEDSSNVE